MSVGKIDVTETLANVEDLLEKDRTLSAASRAMFQLLVTIIQLLVAKLDLNSSNSSIPPSQDPQRQRGAKSQKQRAQAETRRAKRTSRNDAGTPVDNPDQIENVAVDRRTMSMVTIFEVKGREIRHIN